VKLTDEQRNQHRQNVATKLGQAAFFARLADHGIKAASAEPTAELLALADELWFGQMQANQPTAAPISAARAALRKQTANRGIELPGAQQTPDLHGSINKFAASYLTANPDVAESIAALQTECK
jgi:hypothetical protein